MVKRKSEAMDPEIEDDEEEEEFEEEEEEEENDERRDKENPDSARAEYKPYGAIFERSFPEASRFLRIKNAFVKNKKEFADSMYRLSAKFGNWRRSKWEQVKLQHQRNKIQWNRYRDISRHKLSQMRQNVAKMKDTASKRASTVMASASNSITNFKNSGKLMVNSFKGTLGKVASYLGSQNPVGAIFPFPFMG